MQIFIKWPEREDAFSMDIQPGSSVQRAFELAGGTAAKKKNLNALVDESVTAAWSTKILRTGQTVKFVNK